jgi:uncharacterized membrane protein YbhN (UPF0104 family)
MEDTSSQKSKPGKIVKLLLKIIVTCVCLWYVSRKINLDEVGTALKNADWLYLFIALAAFILSKILSAIRLNIYFKNIGIYLGQWENIRLYWLGMFYNLFLPGSISGDAYKIVILAKRHVIPYKKTTSAVLLDRFSGLLGLGIVLCAYAMIALRETWLIFTIFGGTMAGIAALYLVIRKWFRDFLPGFWQTLFWGVAVQVAQVIAIYLIMHALHMPLHHNEYILLFLISSMVAVLPLTIGGLGARELVFLEGSRYFGLLRDTSVLISLLFYFITLVTSAWGLIYVFRDPLKKKERQ